MATAGLLVYLQLCQVDKIDFNSVQLVCDSLGVAILKNYAGGRCEDFNPDGRDTHSDDLIFLQEKIGGEVWNVESKFFQDGDKFCGVFRVGCNPDVHVSRGTWVAVIAYRIAADQQVFNLMCVQQPQKIFEVGW